MLNLTLPAVGGAQLLRVSIIKENSMTELETVYFFLGCAVGVLAHMLYMDLMCSKPHRDKYGD